MAGTTSSSTSGMTTICRKLLNKKPVIKSKNLLKSQKTKTGGEPSGISSTLKISHSLINNLKSSTESEAAKWPPRRSLLQITHMNSNIMTPCPSTPTHPARGTSCPPNGSK